jgi:hypothetical protein
MERTARALRNATTPEFIAHVFSARFLGQGEDCWHDEPAFYGFDIYSRTL